MANHASAVKRHRQSLKKALRNSHYKSTAKTAMKKALAAAEKKTKDAAELIKKAISTVDAVKGKGIFPANRAGRYVSQLATKLSELAAKN